MYLLGFGNIRVNVKIDPIVIEMCGFFHAEVRTEPVARAEEYLHRICSFQPFPRTEGGHRWYPLPSSVCTSAFFVIHS